MRLVRALGGDRGGFWPPSTLGLCVWRDHPDLTRGAGRSWVMLAVPMASSNLRMPYITSPKQHHKQGTQTGWTYREQQQLGVVSIVGVAVCWKAT